MMMLISPNRRMLQQRLVKPMVWNRAELFQQRPVLNMLLGWQRNILRKLLLWSRWKLFQQRLLKQTVQSRWKRWKLFQNRLVKQTVRRLFQQRMLKKTVRSRWKRWKQFQNRLVKQTVQIRWKLSQPMVWSRWHRFQQRLVMNLFLGCHQKLKKWNLLYNRLHLFKHRLLETGLISQGDRREVLPKLKEKERGKERGKKKGKERGKWRWLQNRKLPPKENLPPKPKPKLCHNANRRMMWKRNCTQWLGFIMIL